MTLNLLGRVRKIMNFNLNHRLRACIIRSLLYLKKRIESIANLESGAHDVLNYINMYKVFAHG